jgi:hypothetical protein
VKHRSFRTFAAAVSIAAAGLGAAGTAAAAPLQLNEAAPIDETATEPGTGSAALLPALLPLLLSGSADGGTQTPAGGPAAAAIDGESNPGAATGSADTLLPVLLPLLISGSAEAPAK